jgi:hypothetical protein
MGEKRYKSIGDVQGETVDSWKKRLPEIIQGYDSDDVWNMDETGKDLLAFSAR